MYARVGVPSGIQDTTYQENRESAKLVFNQETFVDVVMENLRLQKELNEALNKVLELKKESNKGFLSYRDMSPHLRIA
jgi:ABC-type phosphate transport system auxiliary subunit